MILNLEHFQRQNKWEHHSSVSSLKMPDTRHSTRNCQRTTCKITHYQSLSVCFHFWSSSSFRSGNSWLRIPPRTFDVASVAMITGSMTTEGIWRSRPPTAPVTPLCSCSWTATLYMSAAVPRKPCSQTKHHPLMYTIVIITIIICYKKSYRLIRWLSGTMLKFSFAVQQFCWRRLARVGCATI